MRENRPYGSEGGVAKSHPDPYPIYRSAPSAQYGFAYCALRLLSPWRCATGMMGNNSIRHDG